jgi:hypothetical protein
LRGVEVPTLVVCIVVYRFTRVLLWIDGAFCGFPIKCDVVKLINSID